MYDGDAVTSEPGVGSTFTVTLSRTPRRRPPGGEAAAAAAGP